MHTKLASVALAMLLVVGASTVAFAQRPTPHDPSPGGKDGKRHGIFGTITSISAGSFTVQTKEGDVVVTVTADTRFHIPTKRNATFADLAKGDRVAVNGTPTSSGITAKQVAVAPGKPTIRHRVGKVTAYTLGTSITIQDAQGGSETFVVNAQTIIRNPKGGGVAIGDRVTIVSRRDPSTDTFTASAIVVHPQ